MREGCEWSKTLAEWIIKTLNRLGTNMLMLLGLQEKLAYKLGSWLWQCQLKVTEVERGTLLVQKILEKNFEYQTLEK